MVVIGQKQMVVMVLVDGWIECHDLDTLLDTSIKVIFVRIFISIIIIIIKFYEIVSLSLLPFC